MKFKATFTDRGLRTLEKGTGYIHKTSLARCQHQAFLLTRIIHTGVCPALERHGKACHALLSREDVHLIQTTMEADGMLICARWDIVRHPHTGHPLAACNATAAAIRTLHHAGDLASKL